MNHSPTLPAMDGCRAPARHGAPDGDIAIVTEGLSDSPRGRVPDCRIAGRLQPLTDAVELDAKLPWSHAANPLPRKVQRIPRGPHAPEALEMPLGLVIIDRSTDSCPVIGRLHSW
ncbi:MAG TPA: hypothetical protein VLH79_15385 [Chthonomonadales bacterium]|nr:hypothetical protein [Chthonomonadales bacterium]